MQTLHWSKAVVFWAGIFNMGCAPSIRTAKSLAPTIPISPCGPGKEIFSYTGANQTFNLPSTCVSSPYIFAKMWGAGGGGSPNYSEPGYSGGGGAYAWGSASVPWGQALEIIVAGGGQTGIASSGNLTIAGGYGGGGVGFSTWLGAYHYGASGGGGRSALQMNGQELMTAAGGGGGSGSQLQNRSGGAGGDHLVGGVSGQAGGLGTTDSCAGQGAAPAAGGAAGIAGSNGYPGTQYVGGAAATNNASGGGGGYYGGGGGGTNSNDPCSGGGGSSYIGGMIFGNSIAGSGTTPGNTTDADWDGVSGIGGTAAAGGNGLVIIYYGATQIVSISPSAGISAGGTTITIRGLGFVSGTAVTIAGSPCINLNIQSTNQLTCVTPSTGSLGPADVVLNTPGALTATLSGGFNYTP